MLITTSDHEVQEAQQIIILFEIRKLSTLT